MEKQTTRNENRSFTHENFGNIKLSKSKELNPNMTIKEASPDEYQNKLENLNGNGGQTNG